MVWTLLYQNVKKTLDAWGIFNVSRHRQNQGTDTLTFQSDAKNCPFRYDETLAIYQEEQCWFRGRIQQIPANYAANNESKTYYVAGPSWYLEHLIYQQPWQYYADGQTQATVSVSRSLCILGQDESGNPLPANRCIQAIIAYAKAHGAPILCGEIAGFDFTFPCESLRDCSCYEALLKLLRWTPDAVVWFDYSTPQPTFHCKRAALLPLKTFALQQLSRFSLIPRNDLKMNAVVLKYEHTHSNGDASWITTTRDAYPSNASAEDFNTLVFTLELEGSRMHTQEQWVLTQPIQTDSIAWWKQHFPCIQFIPDKDIHITATQRTTSLPNELLEGAIAPWMGCKATYETISADVSYTTKEETVEHCIFALKICATDAISKTYRKVLFLSSGMEPPKNLAKTLYEATSCLQYEGRLQFECNEFTQCFLGYALAFIGGDPTWEKLHLPIQEERFFLDEGRVQLSFGAPKQLGPNDLCQLMHTHRSRQLTVDPQMRFADKRSGASKTYFPHMTPVVNSMTHSGHYTQLTVGDKQRQIVLDARALPPGTQLALKQYDIVENGQLKKIWLLSS